VTLLYTPRIARRRRNWTLFSCSWGVKWTYVNPRFSLSLAKETKAVNLSGNRPFRGADRRDRDDVDELLEGDAVDICQISGWLFSRSAGSLVGGCRQCDRRPGRRSSERKARPPATAGRQEPRSDREARPEGFSV